MQELGMLVSSIARFNAVNTMNNAAMGAMTASSSVINTVSHAKSFGGEHDLAMLNKMDKKYSLDLASNSLLYKIAYLQEKRVAKQQDSNIKTFSAFA